MYCKTYGIHLAFEHLQDEHLPPLSHVMRRIDQQTLTTLYIVDCRPHLDDESFAALQLRTLVLSQTHLRSLPSSLFSMSSLETLKVDRNSLAEIPADVGRLSALRTFCCDSQRPRLRSLPVGALSRLARLEVLSFADNRIADVGWIPGPLSRLRVLRCDRNAIVRLPVGLVDLQRLTTLDVSHNRIDRIPAGLGPLVRRLFRFEYFNLTLRPRQIRRCRARLLAHLDLENFLATLNGQLPQPSSLLQQNNSSSSSTLPIAVLGGSSSHVSTTSSPATAARLNHRGGGSGSGGGGSSSIEEVDRRPTVRDITVAFVGETHSGKTSLVAALRDELGISRTPDGRPGASSSGSQSSSAASSSYQGAQHHHASYSSAGGFELHQFEMRSPLVQVAGAGGGGGGGGGGSSPATASCHVCALVLGNEVLDSFSQQVYRLLHASH